MGVERDLMCSSPISPPSLPIPARESQSSGNNSLNHTELQVPAFMLYVLIRKYN